MIVCTVGRETEDDDREYRLNYAQDARDEAGLHPDRLDFGVKSRMQVSLLVVVVVGVRVICRCRLSCG